MSVKWSRRQRFGGTNPESLTILKRSSVFAQDRTGLSVSNRVSRNKIWILKNRHQRLAENIVVTADDREIFC
jgi:hypothetical protein